MSRDDPLGTEMLSSIAERLPAEADMAAMQFEPVDRSTLQHQVYQQLRRAVMGGLFKPGTPITIRAVADALGVSPMPARSALQRLEIEGALVARGGKRTLVIPEMTQAEYQEMVEIGVLLEGMAAEHACTRITQDEIAVMQAACTAMQHAADNGDLEGYVTANWTFHRTLYAASRLNTLMSFIEMRWLRIGPYVRHMMPDQQSLIDSMPNHWTVLSALERRDAMGASNAIRADLRDCAQTLLPLLPGDPA
ncbi:GntR family transcriptional regulator [Sphingomonas sp. BGYR3]|uniref:GntR family transcriptional regulator n=1 Tax=Sphingomonas sp. BGYR3 TaxID=2975483 RepID=UPI0021A65BFE|nr:GntR family transcriptional regulator [Sphingomonas sp. BGYR3]MDG5487826.1 GntR family transcriptional regulator [Sphingomonas sp. BGYR3]